MNLFKKIKVIFTNKDIRNKVLFVLGIIALFRFLSTVPIPGVSTKALERMLEGNSFLEALGAFSGGGFSHMSILLIGVMPYITASIVFNLATYAVPKLKEMQQEGGDEGRRRIANYSRLLSVPLAAIQAFGMLKLSQHTGVIDQNMTNFQFFSLIMIVTAGSVLLMWLGELISEFGVGNGVSLIIFAGIVSSMPGKLLALKEKAFKFNTETGAFEGISDMLPIYIAIILFIILMIYFIVFVQEAERPIPINHASQSRGVSMVRSMSSSIPIKLNMAGVIPLIFAVALMVIPRTISAVLTSFDKGYDGIFKTLSEYFTYGNPVYVIIYFLFVFFFTFFYTTMVFEPKRISENLQNSGAFIPGVRPGEETVAHLEKVVTRTTFIGAAFLSIIAITPFLIQWILKDNNSAIAIGGTSILIMVSVAVDLVKKIDGMITMSEYK